MIVIPMAGLSSRFTKAGYRLPKFMLPARGKTVFRHAVESFAAYFGREPFLFVLRDSDGAPQFVARECAAMGLDNPLTVVLDRPTRGQADTVRQGLTRAGLGRREPLVIFNIDSIRPGFRHPDWAGDCDGYLEVVSAPGDNWSFAEECPDKPGFARRVTEKERISDLCSDGLYAFSRAGFFLDALAVQEKLPAQALAGGELYVAPLYNWLIDRGLRIRLRRIAPREVMFCGVPEEYEAFCRQGGAEGGPGRPSGGGQA